MARAFDDRPSRRPAEAAATPAAALESAVPPARTFAHLAGRLHGGALVQRYAADRPARDFSGISGPGRPPVSSGLPASLRADIEARSGLPMDDVRVHRGSGHPARIGALAYAQGRDIHLGPGQERHLAHEAWHVVQQKQGRVRPTLWLGGVGINDDAGLEREADAGQPGWRGLGRDGTARGQDGHDPSGGDRWSASCQRVKIKKAAGKVDTVADHEAMAKYSKEFAELLNSATGACRDQLIALCSETKTYDDLESFLSKAYGIAIAGRMTPGGYVATTSTAFKRSDSLGNIHAFDGSSIHQDLKDANAQYAKNNGGRPTTNYVRMAVSINYRIGQGTSQSVETATQKINHQWTSGGQQPVLSTSGTKTETESNVTEVDAYVQSDRVAKGDLKSFSKLTSISDREKIQEEDWQAIEKKAKKPRHQIMSKKKGRTDKPMSLTEARKAYGIKARPIGLPTSGSDVHVSDESLRHSEVAAAAMKVTRTKLSSATKALISAVPKKATVLNIVLSANSYPNTMCMNLCRSAMQDLYGDFHSGMQFDEKSTTVSAKFGTVFQVSAPYVFQIDSNKVLKSFIEAKDDTVPLVRGGQVAIEIAPQSLDPKPASSKKRKRKSKKAVAETETEEQSQGHADDTSDKSETDSGSTKKKKKKKRRKTTKTAKKADQSDQSHDESDSKSM